MRQSQPGSLVSVQRTMGYAPCAGEAINAVMRERLTGARSLIKAWHRLKVVAEHLNFYHRAVNPSSFSSQN